jgi:hypothetical protein
MGQSDRDTGAGARPDLRQRPEGAVWSAPHLIRIDLSRTAASDGINDDGSFTS